MSDRTRSSDTRVLASLSQSTPWHTRNSPMVEESNFNRRSFLRTIAMTLAVTPLGWLSSTGAQSGNAEAADVPAIKPGTNTSFAAIKQIDAGVLNVGYAEAGPADGPAV